MPIGVYDSGLGGLTVLEALTARLPDQDFIYLGDSAHAPIGTKTPEQIYEITRTGVKTLFFRGCNLVILACNTASAVALHDLQVGWLDPRERRVLGVFVPVIEYLTRRDWGDNSPPTHTGLHDVALFATPATVQSAAFPRELRFRARDVTVTPQACAGLVDAIEDNDLGRARSIAAGHVEELLTKLPNPQCAVLGCTHYPLVEDAFRAALPPQTTLVSQPALIADSLADYLHRHPEFRGGSGEVRYLTTGPAGPVSTSAKTFTGHEISFASA